MHTKLPAKNETLKKYFERNEEFHNTGDLHGFSIEDRKLICAVVWHNPVGPPDLPYFISPIAASTSDAEIPFY